jgi:purine-nucleoside phosphorylase
MRLAGKLGMRVLTISCLTNFAAGISKQPLTHDEVMETADRISGDFARLVRGIILAL